MAYSVNRITTIDLTVLRGLFDACEDKVIENYTELASYSSSDDRFIILSKNMRAWAANGMCLECRKDDTVVFVSCGELKDSHWKVMYFLAGPDASGSRSFLYDTDWLIAMRDFHLTMTDVYTSHEVIHTPDKSAKTHFDAMINTANSDARFNHNVSDDKTVDTDFKSRTIRDIT